MFSIQCQECGGVCCYADDSTYTATGSDPLELSEKLSEKYNVLANFLTANKLKVNDDKTHLLVMSTRKKNTSQGHTHDHHHSGKSARCPSTSRLALEGTSDGQ